MRLIEEPLHLDQRTFRYLLEQLGPSLGVWRAAEVAALRAQHYPRPLLDLGCGDGLVSALVFDQVDIGLDPDADGVRKAGRRGLYHEFVTAPVEQAPLPDASVQTVVSNSVFEHIQPLEPALCAVGRMLAPGGTLVLTTPTPEFSRWLLLPSERYRAWRNRHLIHKNLLTLDQWCKLLARAGLQVEQVRYYLRRRQVTAWDALEMLQLVWVARKRLLGVLWKSLPPRAMDRLAYWAEGMDMSAREQGGGCLIVARKVERKFFLPPSVAKVPERVIVSPGPECYDRVNLSGGE